MLQARFTDTLAVTEKKWSELMDEAQKGLADNANVLTGSYINQKYFRISEEAERESPLHVKNRVIHETFDSERDRIDGNKNEVESEIIGKRKVIEGKIISNVGHRDTVVVLNHELKTAAEDSKITNTLADEGGKEYISKCDNQSVGESNAKSVEGYKRNTVSKNDRSSVNDQIGDKNSSSVDAKVVIKETHKILHSEEKDSHDDDLSLYSERTATILEEDDDEVIDTSKPPTQPGRKAEMIRHRCENLVGDVVKSHKDWIKSFVMITVVDANSYILYAPMYILYALEAYPEYYVAIYVNGHIHRRIWEIMIQIPHDRWCLKEYHENNTKLSSTPSLSRFLLVDSFIRQFRYAYFGDVDIAIIRAPEGKSSLLKGHRSHARLMALPYSNVRRTIRNPKCTEPEAFWRGHKIACNRMTGLHFIDVKAWYVSRSDIEIEEANQFIATSNKYSNVMTDLMKAAEFSLTGIYIDKLMRVEGPHRANFLKKFRKHLKDNKLSVPEHFKNVGGFACSTDGKGKAQQGNREGLSVTKLEYMKQESKKRMSELKKKVKSNIRNAF
eukprot:CFRG4539T1